MKKRPQPALIRILKLRSLGASYVVGRALVVDDGLTVE